MKEQTLQGALTFLGFAISIIAVFYFAVVYIPRVSEWTQLAALILLGEGLYARVEHFLAKRGIGKPAEAPPARSG